MVELPFGALPQLSINDISNGHKLKKVQTKLGGKERGEEGGERVTLLSSFQIL